MATDLNTTELEEPQSRNEKILAKALGTYTGELEEPQSRMEKLLSALTASIADIAGNGSTDSGSGSLLNYEIVDTLPDSGAGNTIYFVKKDEDSDSDGTDTDDAAGKNLYREYVWLNDAFEELGGGETAADSGSSGTVKADWSVMDETESGYIKNKPAISAGSTASAILSGEASSAKGKGAHAEGISTEACKDGSHAEGNGTKAAENYSHSEGSAAVASGLGSHAEGADTKAQGPFSHAEGFDCTTAGLSSHAEGQYTTAKGAYSHAEGESTAAKGSYSHAEGCHTAAAGEYSHVSGRYNVEDASGSEGVYAEIVGNGTGETKRSNARTLDWNGNEVLAGKLTVGTGPENDLDAATKKYVDGLVADLQAEIEKLTSADGTETAAEG